MSPRLPLSSSPLSLALAIALLVPAAARAQEAPPPADPADVASIDAIMAAVYDVISGPAGEVRDWDRFRSLFIPGARLIPTGRPQEGGAVRARVMSPDDYVTSSGPYLEERGFFEDEIGRVVERFGPVVHLMSAYESRNRADDPEPFARGVNSFQLLDDGERWWVVSIYWAQETPDNPIPGRLLNTGM
jgi:hypothetical protein